MKYIYYRLPWKICIKYYEVTQNICQILWGYAQQWLSHICISHTIYYMFWIPTNMPIWLWKSLCISFEFVWAKIVWDQSTIFNCLGLCRSWFEIKEKANFGHSYKSNCYIESHNWNIIFVYFIKFLRVYQMKFLFINTFALNNMYYDRSLYNRLHFNNKKCELKRLHCCHFYLLLKKLPVLCTQVCHLN